MKLMRIIVLLSVLYCIPVFAEFEDKIVEAIEKSDPKALRGLIIPGFLIRLEDKKKYIALAHTVTNRTHADLQKFSLNDIWCFGKALGYLAMGGSMCGTAAHKVDWRKYYGILWPAAKAQTADAPAEDGKGDQADDVGSKQSVINFITENNGTLYGGALGIYFIAKSMRTFHDVLTNKHRLKIHNNALIIEAIISRLPAFDNGCFIPGSAN